MPTFSVSGTGSRFVKETVYFTVEVTAPSLAGVEQAVRDALSRGEFDFDDSEYDTDNCPRPTLVSLDSIEREEPVLTAPVEAYTATTRQGYQPAQTNTGAAGIAVARVETRENGYSPARVRHVPGR
jgi:hypothetical protein